MIEDDHAIAENVIYMLEIEGFTVIHAEDGDTGLAEFRSSRPRLVLLDIGLPGLSGYELLKAIRRSDPTVPVIMVTAEHDEINKIMGFEMGADDYVTKPFGVLELIARIKAVLRRSIAVQAPQADQEVTRHGPLELIEENLQLVYYKQPIACTRAEFKLIAQLVRFPARVFQRDELINAMYSDEHAVTPRSVDACIKRLRRKLFKVRPAPNPIESIYGEGYKLAHFPEDGN
jgi:DNA-binding response OmpR family regulator